MHGGIVVRLVIILGGIIVLTAGAWLVLRKGMLPLPGGTAAPDVILITVDTLRADRLGCYGAATRTPNIDRLAVEGMLFEHAASPIPETRPAHFTIFTSRYPRDHGVVSNLSTANADLLTLPEIYAQAGYLSAGFAGCLHFDDDAGAELGFSVFDAPETPQRTAGEVVPRAIEWLESLAPDQRVFLWLHLFDPHMPYQPPPPFNGGGPSETFEQWPDFHWPELLQAADSNDGNLPREVFERARALYDGEVEYVDHWLGRFFQALEAVGRWDRAVVALTADHGECFSKGVFFDHSQCLNDEAIAVPLIVRYPPRVAAGRRVATQVELLDVAPALLRLSDQQVPDALLGRGLLARAEDRGEESYAFFEHPFYGSFDVGSRQEVLDRLRSVAGEPTRKIVGDRLQVGVRSGAWKYLLRGTEETLYNLADDPGELHDLAAGDSARRDRFRLAVRRWMREHPPRLQAETEIHPELRKTLEALGYL